MLPNRGEQGSSYLYSGASSKTHEKGQLAHSAQGYLHFHLKRAILRRGR
eukprot:CAMPEP_0195125944 /NCGR_PEP_ID=MMETSP0448-20130528/133998_1 /TAXON_ID=66468 /ORGANISM="Heterocapsa triquestra, Strain CCMP 448" /LENGTH=48 /DNA_ID= /DNA_START= /DNA_END= /DNA_ORIENTATION=